MLQSFSDSTNEIEFSTTTGARAFKLQGIGRLIWYKLDGKHTIKNIIDIVATELGVQDKEVLRKDVINLLAVLVKRGIVYANWDPLYKSELSQELI